MEKKTYGKFHTGDSYIVLQVSEFYVMSHHGHGLHSSKLVCTNREKEMRK